MTNLSDRDLQPEAILNSCPSPGREQASIRVSAKDFHRKSGCDRGKDVIEGMSTRCAGEFRRPGAEKINDTTDGTFPNLVLLERRHRWVLTFVNGKVSKVQVY